MRRHPRSGMTLFELLVVLAILLILLGLLLPAIAKARARAKETQTSNNLKQLGLALYSHNDVYGFLPPGVDGNHFSASAKLLPFIEQANLYKALDFKKPIDDKANSLRSAQVKTFLSPRDPILTVRPDCGATNYLFNDMVFGLNSKARIPASFPDGTSNTIVIGETLKGDGGTRAKDVRRQYVRLKKGDLKGLKDDAGMKFFKDNQNIAGDRCACWIDGRFLMGTFNGRLQPNDPRPDVSCEGVGGVSALRAPNDTVYVALADGSVRGVNAKRISVKTWRNAINPADGQALGPDW